MTIARTTGTTALAGALALTVGAAAGINDQQFEGTGTILAGPQGCPLFSPDDGGQGLILQNTGGFLPGTRVFVSGTVNLQSTLCQPITLPGLEDNTIGEVFEGCVVLTAGPQGCLFAQTSDGGFFVTGTSGQELIENSRVTAVIVPDSTVCFPVSGPALDVLVLDPCLEGDVNGDGSIGFADLSTMLARWGACTPAMLSCHTDLDKDGSTGFADLSRLLDLWGSSL